MISLVVLGKRQRSHSPLTEAREAYLTKAGKYLPAKTVWLADEAAWSQWIAKRTAALASWVVLFEPTGKNIGSPDLARQMQRARDGGLRQLIFAVGPPDGWSESSLREADLLLSLGAMTLPHELAALIAAEQIYRALTIIAGHPYHLGH